jgi:hypothetical protein
VVVRVAVVAATVVVAVVAVVAVAVVRKPVVIISESGWQNPFLRKLWAAAVTMAIATCQHRSVSCSELTRRLTAIVLVAVAVEHAVAVAVEHAVAVVVEVV